MIYYTPKKGLVTYYMQNSQDGYKIEYSFASIKTIYVEDNNGDLNKFGGIVVELNKSPLFFHVEASNTNGFVQCQDFTEERQVSQCMVHHLGGDPWVLNDQVTELSSLETFANRHSAITPSRAGEPALENQPESMLRRWAAIVRSRPQATDSEQSVGTTTEAITTEDGLSRPTPLGDLNIYSPMFSNVKLDPFFGVEFDVETCTPEFCETLESRDNETVAGATLSHGDLIETKTTEYLDLNYDELRDITYEDIVDQETSGSYMPDSESLGGIMSRFQRLQDTLEGRSAFLDRGMRLLSSELRAKMKGGTAKRTG